MSARRVILLVVLALFIFLGLYTWNQRTGQWDSLGAHTGLEATGTVLRVFHSAKDSVVGVWDRYLALVGVRERNDELEKEIADLRLRMSAALEEHAELERLRKFLHLDYPLEWPTQGARVLAWRMGPNTALESLMLSRGYLSGATPGTPLISYHGLVGRVFKAGPATSQALLVTDPGSCVAVVTANSRVQGILAGGGAGAPMEMRFVRQNSRVTPGEVLLTSGLDSAYPKGVPVARIVSVSSGSSFMQEVRAIPLVNFGELEEVLLLERPVGWFTLEPAPVYTRRPAELAPPLEQEDQNLDFQSRDGQKQNRAEQALAQGERPQEEGTAEGQPALAPSAEGPRPTAATSSGAAPALP